MKIKIKPLDRFELRDFNSYYDRSARQEEHIEKVFQIKTTVGEAKEKE